MDDAAVRPALPEGAPPQARQRRALLLASVFVIATCGLIYELVAGTLASYLLGDSVTQFSTIIGTYLFAMGTGSWLSGYISGDLLRWFVRIEILVGIVGGFSAPLLFILFAQAESFRVLLYALVGLTGILVGLEIPLLMRILKNSFAFKDLVSRVFTFDYIGALLASLVFPLVLVPRLGLVRTSLFFGLVNVGVAALLLFQFPETRRYRAGLMAATLTAVAAMLLGFVYAERLATFAEGQTYGDAVIYAHSTPYQRMVLTRNARELRLYLNGNLQFSSADEYRYHEALVHPAAQALPDVRRVLILGGGDGLAAREVLKYPHAAITLVDLDPAMTAMFRTNPLLTALNQQSLSSPRLRLINADAYAWLRADTGHYDLILIDFPDPSNFSIGKLYSTAFYREVYRALDAGGIVVVQSTSPYIARRSYWCIGHTLGAAGFTVVPYHAYVPSFGEWGYAMAMKAPVWRAGGSRLPRELRFVDSATMVNMLRFPPDMAELPTDTNRLDNAALVHYFEGDWEAYR